MRKVKVAIIGAGTAGLTALGVVRKQTEDFVIINEGWYGTTCAKVGCMPSKVLIQIADDFDRLKKLSVEGIRGVENASVDTATAMQRVRKLRDAFVGNTVKFTDSLPAGKNLNGKAVFLSKNQLEVSLPDGTSEQIEAERIILATGSRPIMPTQWAQLGPQVVTSDNFFELESLPKRVAVIGLGVIGLELGQAMARLGLDVTGIEMADTIAGISDPSIKEKALQLMRHDMQVHLGVAAQLEKLDDIIRVSAGGQSYEVDLVLVAMGRRPNLDNIGLENIGVALDERGMPPMNPETMQIAGTDIYIAGDATGSKAILHEAADEGRIAITNALATLSEKPVGHYAARTPLAMAFTHPNIACFGARFSELEQSNTAVGEFDFNETGRPKVMQETEGLVRLYADKTTKKLLGGEMIAPRGEHLVHQLAWVMQLQTEVADILRLPFYHPNLEEGLRVALRSLAKQLYSPAEVELISK
ncbi:dihydrolipoyl dehydrogenase [Reinekea marinisedimentorum]|uniref:Dihydrolipoamide dehydrogenase n=1 Tax=Reinekea marinisedimentorum TaxID=230495 RepID=A0A4R3I639_9GAMM|nr:dihydrolipoyl dehydrogenase [Reinekea marinisedimentorum]TCS41158.1 dihydrolipoamide dehydrogenase [Reinekea marinisedimentorum]